MAELLSNGWDNLGALVDGRWIFRFPQRPEYRRHVERSYLDALREQCPVPIPRVHYWSEDPPFMGYESLPGVQALNAWFEAAELGSWVPALAEDLAAFYDTLHTRISVAQAQAWGAPKGPGNWASPEKQRAQAEALPEPLRSFALRLFDQGFEAAPDLALHGDVHFGNLRFDPPTRRLSGLFDFGDACWGDPAFELYDLAGRSPDIAWAVKSAYERRTGRAMSWANARRYALGFSLTVFATEDLASMKDMAMKRLWTLLATEMPSRKGGL